MTFATAQMHTQMEQPGNVFVVRGVVDDVQKLLRSVDPLGLHTSALPDHVAVAVSAGVASLARHVLDIPALLAAIGKALADGKLEEAMAKHGGQALTRRAEHTVLASLGPALIPMGLTTKEEENMKTALALPWLAPLTQLFRTLAGSLAARCVRVRVGRSMPLLGAWEWECIPGLGMDKYAYHQNGNDASGNAFCV